MSTAKQARAAAYGLLHPVVGADGVALADHRPLIGRFVERIPEFKFAHAREQQFDKFSANRLLYQNPLHRKTRLPCIGKSPGDAASGSVGEIGVAVHRSEEHTSELQSLRHLVCRLLLEK